MQSWGGEDTNVVYSRWNGTYQIALIDQLVEQ